MIENIKILNYKGIESLDISFIQKNVSYKSINSEQVVTSKLGQNYMLTPTFIAKNAAGKSSMVKALNYISKFSDFNELKKIIANYFKNTLRKHLSDSLLNNVNSSETASPMNEENIKIQLATGFIFEIFKENAHVGKDLVFVEVKTDDENIISFTSSPIDFVLNVNKTRISFNTIFSKLLAKIDLKLLPRMLSPNKILAFEEKLQKHIDKIMQKYQYGKVINLHTIVRNDMVKIDRVKVQQNMLTVANRFGFVGLKNLLNEIDPHITNVEYDVHKDALFIFLKSDNSTPFVPELHLSFGTKKMLDIIAKAVDVFKTGGALIIDEIETGLHLSLVKLVVTLFHDDKLNTGKAQLVSTTHVPFIFEKGIISAKNAFVSTMGTFKPLKSSNIIRRTEDLELSLRTKNYYSDEFWISGKEEPMSTISDASIQNIVETFAIEENKEQGNN